MQKEMKQDYLNLLAYAEKYLEHPLFHHLRLSILNNYACFLYELQDVEGYKELNHSENKKEALEVLNSIKGLENNEEFESQIQDERERQQTDLMFTTIKANIDQWQDDV